MHETTKNKSMKNHTKDFKRFSVNENDPQQMGMDFPQILRRKGDPDSYKPLVKIPLPPDTVYYEGKRLEEGREMQDLIEVLEVADQYGLRVVIDSGMTVGYIGRQSDLDALIDDIDMEIVDY